jgi:hypothetical protein
MEALFNTIQSAATTMVAGMMAAGGIFMLIAVLLFSLLVFYFFRIHIAYRMAVNRRRDPLGWVLLSLFVSPVMTWIILLIAGDNKR